MDTIYIVCIANPSWVVADNPRDVDEYDIYEVFDSLENARGYLKSMGFEWIGYNWRLNDQWQGPSPWYENDDEPVEVGAWIVERKLQHDCDFMRVMLGDEYASSH